MQQLIQGNEACALGAVTAGCSFFAGYPISPSSEIMEWMARLLPARGGVFVQMEDELSSMGAVIGASWTGAKAMTATSGPGFSLMQEHIGYAAMTETPCVIVNAQRVGPSTGMPTMPAQGDVMQARWGSHGDRPAIALTASSVLDTYTMTIEAFNLSERYRLPVVLLLDATLAHMRENMAFPEIPVVDRARPASLDGFQPFGSPEFLPFGEGARFIVSGLSHDEAGHQRASASDAGERLVRRSIERLDRDADQITHTRQEELEDAELVFVTYGITARAARAAVRSLREDGVRAGLLELLTLWPFPRELVGAVAHAARAVVVPELNLGQVVLLVRALAGTTPVVPLGRMDGVLLGPDDIAATGRSALALAAQEASAR
jgi:2-oxoglutarate/2-oxoacid ferredoxin oxidoreductase subunit alpha